MLLSQAFYFALFQHFNERQWLDWIDALADNDYVIIDSMIDVTAQKELVRFFDQKHVAGVFQPAGIGANDQLTIARSIRGDLNYWLDEHRDVAIASFWSLVQETVQVLNRHCYLSLSGFEFQMAYYPPGKGYQPHFDQFNGRNNRLISMVIYLNEEWTVADGGELQLLLPEGTLSVMPIARRGVLFKSDKVLHAVSPNARGRKSLSGWLLNHPAALGKFFG